MSHQDVEDFFSGMEKIDPTYSKPLSLMDIDFAWVRNCDHIGKMKDAVSLLERDGAYQELLSAAQKKLKQLQKQSGPTSDYVKQLRDDINTWADASKGPASKDPTEKSDLPPVRGKKGKEKKSQKYSNFSEKKRKQLAEKEKIKGNEAFRARDFEEAVQYYSSAIEFDTENSIFYSNRSQAYLKLGKYSLAEKDATSALEIAPNNAKALNRRGQSRYNLKKFEAALQDFTRANEILPGNKQVQTSIQKCKQEAAKRKPSQINKKTSNNSIKKTSTRIKILETSDSESEEENVNASKSTPQESISVKKNSNNDVDDDEKDDVDQELPPLEPKDLPDLQKQKKSVPLKIEEINENDEKSSQKESPNSTSEAKNAEGNGEFDRSKIFSRSESIKTEGNVLFKQGQIDKAIRIYENALHATKEILLERGDVTNDNVQDFEMTELGGPVCSKLHGNITLCYQQLEDFRLSVHHSTKAFEAVNQQQTYRGLSWKELKTLKIKALMRRALAYERMGKNILAYDDLMHVHRIDSSIPKVMESLPRLRKAAQSEMSTVAAQKKDEGNSLVSKKEYSSALQAYNEGLTALKFDNPSYIRSSDKPVVISLLMNRALVHLNLKQFREAASDCDIVIKHFDKTNVKAFYRRALAFKDMEEYELAKEDVSKVLELNPGAKGQAEGLITKLDKLIEKKKQQQQEEEEEEENVADDDGSEDEKRDDTSENVDGEESKDELQRDDTAEENDKKVEIAEPLGSRDENNGEDVTQENISFDTQPKTSEKEEQQNEEEKENFFQNEEEEEEESNSFDVSQENGDSVSSIASRPPRNQFEFMKVYNNLKSKSDELYKYLKLISPSKLPVLFGDNLEESVMASLISIIRKHGIEDSPGKSYSFLKYLAKTSRFELNLMFLSDEDKQDLRDVLELLSNTTGFNKKQIEELKDQYSV